MTASDDEEEQFIIHPVTARRVLRKRKRQCTGCKQKKTLKLKLGGQQQKIENKKTTNFFDRFLEF